MPTIDSRRSPCQLADSQAGSPVATFCASLPVGTGLWTVHDPFDGPVSRRTLGCAPQFTVHNSQLTIPGPLTTNNHHSSTLCPWSPCQLADSQAGSPVATFCASLPVGTGLRTVHDPFAGLASRKSLRFAPLPTAECQQSTVDGPPASSQTHRQGVPSLLALRSTIHNLQLTIHRRAGREGRWPSGKAALPGTDTIERHT